jgi:hypothetical protein
MEDEAIGFIGASGLSRDEKDTLGGILLADRSLAAVYQFTSF